MSHLRCPAGVMVAAGFHVGAPYGRATAPARARIPGRVGMTGHEQLSLGELLPGQTHGHWTTHDTEHGHVAECHCGWLSRAEPYASFALRNLREHVGRTPQGERLRRTLSKRGRGSTDA